MSEEDDCPRLPDECEGEEEVKPEESPAEEAPPPPEPKAKKSSSDCPADPNDEDEDGLVVSTLYILLTINCSLL
jgi:hypothetical protein